jgi:hypothetical protein
MINNISKANYGYISDESIFWDEHHLRKLGFERFVSEYFGLNLEYASIEDYEKVHKCFVCADTGTDAD